MSSLIGRYRKLNIEESLSKIHRYPFACEELSLFLRVAYNRAPKNLQALLFRDTITAFQLLPVMQTSRAISAAHTLLKSAEAVLPKQKKNLAVAEFKHAKVAQKRRQKTREEETDSAQLPQDVLVHIFSLLDMRSLLSAGLVCWSWNLAASDNNLWQMQYSVFFGDYNDGSNNKALRGSRPVKEYYTPSETYIDWRGAFKEAYVGGSSKRLRSHRGYCCYCDMIVWHDNLKCPNEHCRFKSENRQIKLVSTLQVVDYVMDDSFPEISSSDSDSESDEESISRLWAYPRHFSIRDM